VRSGAATGSRDWVIKAFNDDLPYTDFIRHQLAGDEVAPGNHDALIATGFYRLGLWDDEPADRLLQKYDILDGVADTSARAFLGMSMGCARCHDHKIDPIPHADYYYSWLAFFHNVRDMQNKGGDMIAIERARTERREKESELTEKIRAFETEVKLAIEKEAAEKAGKAEQSDIVDLSYRFFRDTYTKLPDFDGLRHENEGKLGAGFIDLSPATRNDFIGFVFEGQLVVPRDGTYKFTLDSADGSRLTLDGKQLIDYDGVHPAGAPRQGSVKLKKGNVPIRVDYFNKTGPNVLQLSWSGPGVPVRSLSRGSQTLIKDGRSGGDTWRYTTKAPPGNWLAEDFDDKKWKSGKGGFGRQGTPGVKLHSEWHTNEIWMRKTFSVAALPFAMNLSVYHDEDIEIYINGEKMFEAKGHVSKYIDTQLKGTWKKIVKPGDNVMAVHCRQTVGGQGVDVGLGTGKTSSPGARPMSAEQLARSQGGRILGKRNKDYNDLRKQLEQLRRKPVTAAGTFKVFGVKENGTNPPQTHVLRRGSPHSKGDQVQPRFPSILTDKAVPKPTPVNNSSGMRTVVADYIASTDNQLTARVMVNRVWQHHFGRGIVASSSDFGNIGSKPTHPELLDWLAHHFMHELDWSVKDLHHPRLDHQRHWSTQPQSRRPEFLLRNPRHDSGHRQHRQKQVGQLAPDRTQPSRGLQHRASFAARPDAGRVRSGRHRQSLPGSLHHHRADPVAHPAQQQVQQRQGGPVRRTPTASEIKDCMAMLDDMKSLDGIDEAKALDRLCLLFLNLNEFLFID